MAIELGFLTQATDGLSDKSPVFVKILNANGTYDELPIERIELSPTSRPNVVMVVLVPNFSVS